MDVTADGAPAPGRAGAGPPGTNEMHQRAQEVLRALVGGQEARLREDQWRAIEALVVHRRRTLVVQRTGWGKSAVYFVATLLLREGWGGWEPGTPAPAPGGREATGATMIISPLLALMRDQVAAAQRAGIHAVTMNSANTAQWDEIEAQVHAGRVDVLLVSPERLNNPVFREAVLPRLAADAGLVVIDEAHCVSDWGHDFRPDYRRIRHLLSRLGPGTPVLATTATANARVTADVAEQLASGSRNGPVPGVLVLRGSLERDSLHLGVLRLPDAASRLAWLTEYLHRAPGSGIVYCLTVSAAGEVAEHLRREGLEVAGYTGQTEPAERERLEEELKSNRVKALVATSALGMGFDKPDLGFVVHMGAPNSPVSYYQQVGRAGRGVRRADVVLLPGAEDRAIWQWFGAQGFPPEEAVREVLNALEAARERKEGAVSTAALETSTSLRRTRLESMLKVLDVDGAVRRVRGGWEATGEHWVYDAERYTRVEAARLAEQEAMERYERLQAPQCRMAFLRAALDDPVMPAGWRCGVCDLCGGLSLPRTASSARVEQARRALGRLGVELTARRQWPTGMARLGLPQYSGRIGPALRAAPGLALGRLDGLGISVALRRMIEPAGATPDQGGPAAAPGSPREASGERRQPPPVPGRPGTPAKGGQSSQVEEPPEARGGADGVVPRTLRAPVLELVDRLGAMMRRADGAPGADAVVIVDSQRRPTLVRHLGRAVAHRLGAEPLGVVGMTGPPGRHGVNSATRLAAVARSMSLEGWAPTAVEGLQGRTVVLVDDWTDSGWTLAVAAALLLQAGAGVVHPLVLGQR